MVKLNLNKSKLKAILWTLVISQILTGILGWTIVDPVLQYVMPHRAKICPYPFPQVHDNQQWIRVNIVNDGLPELSQLDVEYKLCYMDKYSKAIMHATNLKESQSDYFEIASELSMNCSYATDPLVFEFYRDKQGRCYSRINSTSSNVCNYCDLEVNVFEEGKLLKNLSYPYPFFKGAVGMEAEIKSGCLPYEEAEDVSELKPVSSKEVRVMLMDPSTACLRGDWDREWCNQNGFKINAC